MGVDASIVGTKLAKSLDDIIAENAVKRAPQKKAAPQPVRARRNAAAAMDVDSSVATRARGGIRKASGRQAQRKPARGRSGRQDKGEDDQIEDGVAAGEFIKVSGESQTKKIAGKISHDCRAGDPPAMLCKGASSLNQAIKAIAVARTYLQEENMDLTCQPAFRDEQQRASLALYLAKRVPVPFPKRGVDELTANKGSNPHKIAGAIAARVREDKAVSLTGIGEDAVSIIMRAICHTRLYLEEDKCDVKALIQFDQVDKDGETLNAVKFNIVVEDV